MLTGTNVEIFAVQSQEESWSAAALLSVCILLSLRCEQSISSIFPWEMSLQCPPKLSLEYKRFLLFWLLPVISFLSVNQQVTDGT